MDPFRPEFYREVIPPEESGLFSRIRGAVVRNLAFIGGYLATSDRDDSFYEKRFGSDTFDRYADLMEESVRQARMQSPPGEIGFDEPVSFAASAPEEPVGKLPTTSTGTSPYTIDRFFADFYELDTPDDNKQAERLGAFAAGIVADVRTIAEDRQSEGLTPKDQGSFRSRRKDIAPAAPNTVRFNLGRKPETSIFEQDREDDLDRNPPSNVGSAVLTAVNSLYFNEPLENRTDYERSRRAQIHRRGRYYGFIGGREYEFLTEAQGILFENIYDNSMKLAPDGEFYRDLAFPIAVRYRNPQERKTLMKEFDDAARRNTQDLMRRVRAGEQLDYDFVIKGGGEYAAVAAQHIRELAPELRILVVDQNDHMGGQFASYGPRPALRMNSRARVGGRYMPYVPRTDGDINSQGPYAILSLNDLQDDIYADNTVRGDMTKMAVTIAADDVAVCTEAGEQYKRNDGRFDVPMRTMFEGRELEYDVRASVVIDARGIRQKSALTVVQGLDAAIADGAYYTTAGIYRHFGGKNTAPGAMHDPMAELDGKVVEVDASGDGGKTAIELLIRALPAETYGPRRRQGPKGIRLVNAPGTTRNEIVETLRSRYSGSFPQFLPKDYLDPAGFIVPFTGKAVSQKYDGNKWRTLLSDGFKLEADVKIDTTNRAGKLDPNDTPGVLSLGPAFYRRPPTVARELLDALGVPDNTDALWLGVPAALTETEKGIKIARGAKRR